MFLHNITNFSLPQLILLSSGILVLYILIQILLDPLQSVPGPFLARFTRLWYFIEIYKGSFEKTEIVLHRKYGPIVRIAPGEYSIDDVDGAKAIYGHGNAFVKAPWYSAWSPPDPSRASLFSDQNPHQHSIQRRKFSSLYSMSSIIGYEPYINKCTSLLTTRLSELASAGHSVNLQHWLQCYAFDVIGEITFGKRFGFLDMGEDKQGVFKSIEARGAYGTFVGVFPWLHSFLFPLLPKTGRHAYVFYYATRQIEERLKYLRFRRDGPPDFITKILQAHEADPEKMTRMDLSKICLSNIGAGSDTTAITLSAILYNLCKYPSTYQRLREELDKAEREGRISNPISFNQAQELPYLQAVLKEGLRLHPAVGLPMQRIVPAEGVTIAGRFIPAGSTVGINPWVSHRNQSVFGSDANFWRPERWLEIEDEGREAEVGRYFLAFGMGSRSCIGKNIGLLEMSKLVPELVRRFYFVLDGEGELRSKNRWLVKQVNFKVRLMVRSGK